MVTPDDERDPLELIAEEFLDLHRRGAAPDINEFIARDPEQSDSIRGLIEMMMAMETVKPPSHATTMRRRGSELMGPAPVRIGDFKIISEIGRGGMGIVYKALQESLDRMVAVKVLPKSSLLDSQQLERFHREAQTAARLHHSNIVPVFGVGEYEGLHYYVMQLISGIGIDRVVRELRRVRDGGTITREAESGAFSAATAASAICRGALVQRASTSSTASFHVDADNTETNTIVNRPTPASALSEDNEQLFGRPYWAALARIGLQVAAALAHAHSQGILHRDIKPSNLLMDNRGVVWVTDFGIAKALEREGITEDGDFVGTLQYMAPEQASGAPTRQSDVYSLGLTLYELATLRRAFVGKTPNELVRRIHDTEAERPARIVPSIPRDLETIILKAITKDPAQRYASAADFADDLRRFLEDRPIRARRATLLEQFTRWTRRNRALAAAAAIAIISLLGAAVAGWTGYVSTQNALQLESDRRREADLARRQAAQNLDLALQAFGDVFDRLAGPNDGIINPDAMDDEDESPALEVRLSEKDAALLERILAFYDAFAEANSGNPKLEIEKARAERRVGDIQKKLGKVDEAAKAFAKSLATFQSIPADFQSDDILIESAGVRKEIALLALYRRRFNDSMAEFNEAVAILTRQVKNPDAPRVRYELVRTQIALGNIMIRRVETDPRRRTPPSSRPARTALSEAQREVENRVLTALATAQDLRREDPGNAGYEFVTAQAHVLGARIKSRTDRTAMHQEYADALRLFETLAAKHPTTPDYRYELSRTLLETGRVSDTGTIPTEILERVHQIAVKLSRDHSEIPAYLDLFGQVSLSLGRVYSETSNLEIGLARLREAAAIYHRLLDRFPTSPNYSAMTAESDLRLAESLLQVGLEDEALAVLSTSVDRLKLLHREPRRFRGGSSTYWSSVETLIRILDKKGQTEAADFLRRELETQRPRRS